MSTLKNITLFITVLISWSCNYFNNRDIKDDIYEITTNILPEDIIKTKIDSVSNLIKAGNEKQKLIRGFLYLAVTDLDKAFNDLNDMMKTSPEDSYVYTGLGMVYMLSPDSAFYYFNKAILLDSKNSLAYFGRSIVLKTYEDKITTISKAIELNPECSMYYSWRGYFYNSIDSTKLAIRDFNKSLSFDRPYPLSFSMLGIIYECKGDYKKAFEIYNQCIAKTTLKRTGYENKGQLFYKMGRYNDAINEYKNALALKETKFHSDESFCFLISKNYSLLNQKDSAYKYLDLALSKDTLYGRWLNEEKDFDNVKNTTWFKEFIRKYSIKKP